MLTVWTRESRSVPVPAPRSQPILDASVHDGGAIRAGARTARLTDRLSRTSAREVPLLSPWLSTPPLVLGSLAWAGVFNNKPSLPPEAYLVAMQIRQSSAFPRSHRDSFSHDIRAGASPPRISDIGRLGAADRFQAENRNPAARRTRPLNTDRAPCITRPLLSAQMAELVDALVSGTSG